MTYTTIANRPESPPDHSSASAANVGNGALTNLTVSVIVTCHNEARFITQAIRSAVEQTAVAQISEIVIVDDGSSDNSSDILSGLADEISLVRIIRTPGLGLSAARNLAIRASSSPLIAILDGDDYWAKDKLRQQLLALSGHPEAGLAYTDFVDFACDDAADAEVVRVRRYSPSTADTLATYFVYDAPIIPSTVVVRRSVLDDVGAFDETIQIGEDTEFFLRIAERWPFQHVPGALLFKRRHQNSISRRLEALLPTAMLVTDRFVERNPRLSVVARRRIAWRYAKVGNDCLKNGETIRGLGHLLRSLSHSPGLLRTYAYVALAFLPFTIRRNVTRYGRRLSQSWARTVRASL